MSTLLTGGPEPLDVIVIGAGQAGLAAGYHLRDRGLRSLLLDAGPAIGHSWRTRWDSLRLFSPAQYDSLPGLSFPAPADTHPSKDEVADYLRDYAERFALPVRVNCEVNGLRRDADGHLVATTSSGTFCARQVVVATGPFQIPHLPTIAADPDPAVRQLHSAAYRNPEQLPAGGRVLVVGAANSGLQIAAELADRCAVSIAVGSKPPEFRQRIAGRDLFFWLAKAGFFTVPASSRIARRLRKRGDLVIGTSSNDLRKRGVGFRPRLTGFTDRTARFADGSTATVDAIVWATGYRPDYSWLQIPDVVVDGQVRHQGGVTHVPGLYFLGLPWQTCRGSALLGFVGGDAGQIADRIAERAAAMAGPDGRAKSWPAAVEQTGVPA